MKRTVFCLSLALAIIAGCASSPRLALDQVKTRRVYQGAKPDIMSAARTFAARDMFKIQSFEEETGRIAGYKSVSFPRSDEAKLILMQVSILPDSPGKWEVTAMFRYARTADVLSREEESLLVECYSSFFGQIEQIAM